MVHGWRRSTLLLLGLSLGALSCGTTAAGETATATATETATATATAGQSPELALPSYIPAGWNQSVIVGSLANNFIYSNKPLGDLCRTDPAGGRTCGAPERLGDDQIIISETRAGGHETNVAAARAFYLDHAAGEPTTIDGRPAKVDRTLDPDTSCPAATKRAVGVTIGGEALGVRMMRFLVCMGGPHVETEAAFIDNWLATMKLEPPTQEAIAAERNAVSCDELRASGATGGCYLLPQEPVASGPYGR